MYLFFSFVLLLLSLYSLLDEILTLYVRYKGRNGYLMVEKVEHTFVRGLGKNKKDAIAPCDYILKVCYVDETGQVINTRASVRARMRIKNGKYYPYFQEGNKLKMKYLRFHKSKVYIDSEQIKGKQGSFALVFVWGFSFLVLLGIFLFLLFS